MMSTPRRNGQLSSCEPCRKSKLRCDHGSPICRRCVARGRSELCIYHPAPLTNILAPKRARKKGSSNPPTKGFQAAPYPDIFDWMNLTQSTCPGSEVSSNQGKVSLRRPGFFGATSHSETLFKDSSDIGLPQDPAIDPAAPVNARQVEVGAQILSLLKHLPFFTELVEVRYKFFVGWVFPPQVIRSSLKQLDEEYRNHVQGLSDADAHLRLLEWSRTIFRRTGSTIKTHPSMTLSEYADLIIHRWELIGVIFALVGAASYQIAAEEPVFRREDIPGQHKQGLRKITVAASEMCIQFCSSLGTITDMLSWLLIQHTIYLCEMYGISDYRPWQSHGNVTSLVFALGLHQYQPDPTVPFFLEEIRKRFMVAAYAMDKEIATFLGRPPRICARYCDLQVPLDISWDELASETGERERALQRLNSEGWNIDGDLEKGSQPRVMLLTSLIREKILEVSLSRETANFEERVNEICRESNERRLKLPPFLQWTPQTEAPYVASLQLEFLYQEFLLWQSLVKRTGNRYEALIGTSREIMGLLLDRISRDIRIGKISHFSINDLCFVGLPVAGILSTELLRQSQAAFADTSSCTASATTFPRAEIIQKLSVFASHLETFFLNREGDYDDCMKGLMYIRKVLDRVLSPHGGSVLEPISESTQGAPGANDGIMDDMDLMALLENFDWEQEIRLCFS
ncbi:hypothetical protein P175DRAFT_0345512 [Aspergillus ochraceoroseus IBT 24754]|uniref:Zn(2)-C6 fungal-type domain-containing protein n=1 Tax=Aspergillus ochraceoroseus IBT 24754 TaxID=1392256 RepID=A0A2T5LP04_9EURO|nr:uncharacterized protein P175DRAFT_0345512 [Aspergillus ochraceoroseus IBT 24754]PTU18014.1 hypothetical protein P175DRAFT_0345512 [Aspergillus ochraceoroseus IBT 24754]